MDYFDSNPAKFIKISDSLDETMRDEADLCRNKYPSIGGLLLVKNKQGDVLLRKNNLVVFRGRLFALEKIFGQAFNTPFNFMPIGKNGVTAENTGNASGSNPNTISDLVLNKTISGDLTSLLNRRVCLFGIGSGGVTSNGWFSPAVVGPTEISITNIPFCEASSVDLEANPDFYVANAKGEYIYKRLNTKNDADHFYPQWVFDTTTNTIAMMSTLHIDESYLSNPPDGIVKRINELALYMANEDIDENGKSVFSDIEMFSKITFETESLYANKELVIEYYIFA
jgi:hypothetical protein